MFLSRSTVVLAVFAASSAFTSAFHAQEPSAPQFTTTQSAPHQTDANASLYTRNKKGKLEYSGPSSVVELAPTPILDEEGKQRLDPDGKPMFNVPVLQQRDKKGHPVFDDASKPVMQTKDNLGYDDHGKKLHAKKEKAPKVVSVNVERGTLTVDGMTGKAGLNYDIKDLKYIYLYAPWVGIIVVSNEPFPGAIEQKKAFDDKTLTVAVADHSFQLTSDKRMLSKKPASAFVLVDRDFALPTRFPVMGFGPIRRPPYAWPGAKQLVATTPSKAPPLPKNLRPTLLLSPCAAGQMRMAGPVVLPGQIARAQPCVAIPRGQASAQASAQ